VTGACQSRQGPGPGLAHLPELVPGCGEAAAGILQVRPPMPAARRPGRRLEALTAGPGVQPIPASPGQRPLQAADMSDDTLIDRAGSRHAYQQVAGALAARLEAGRYPGQLPAERDLAREFGVAYSTARRAMRALRERGLITTISGRGTFPAPGPAGHPAQPATRRARPPPGREQKGGKRG
jgi:GntR family transcriptional regulator